MSSRPVRRRHVFYIPGYDPIHPRRYRELYRSEGETQAELTGYEIALKPRQAGDDARSLLARAESGLEAATAT